MTRTDTTLTDPNPLSLIKGNWVLVMITVIGMLLRLYNLGKKSLWLDEAVIFWVSQSDIREILSQNALLNSAPPLYVLLIHIVSWLGQSEVVLRSFSWLSGTLAIPSIYILCRWLMSKPAALICAFIFAIAPIQVHYSQELREYSLAVLLAIWIVYFYLLFERSRKLGGLIGFTVISSIGIFTQYGLSLLILAINVIFFLNWLTTNRKFRLVIHWAAAQAFLLLIVGAVYWLSLKDQLVQGGFGSFYLSNGYWNTGAGWLGGLPSFLTKNTLQILDYLFPVWLPIWAILILLGVLSAFKTKCGTIFIGVFAASLFIVFLSSVLKYYPYLAGRQILYLSPLFYIVLAFGFEKISQFRRSWVWAGLLIVIFGYIGFRGTFQYLNDPGAEELRPIVSTLMELIEPNDQIYIYYSTEPAFQYYYRHPRNRIIQGIKSREDPLGYNEQLKPYLEQPNRIWLVFSHCVLGECEMIANFAATIRPVEKIQTESGAWLYLAN